MAGLLGNNPKTVFRCKTSVFGDLKQCFGSKIAAVVCFPIRLPIGIVIRAYSSSEATWVVSCCIVMHIIIYVYSFQCSQESRPKLSKPHQIGSGLV